MRVQVGEIAYYAPIDQVLDGVYISGYRATQYTELLRTAGLTNVLKLYADTPYFPLDFNTLELRLEDGEFIESNVLSMGTDFIVRHVNAGEAVLVMCGAGISRSSTFVLSYLLSRGYEARQAYRLLRERHESAAPHPELWRSLIAHYRLNCSVSDCLDWQRED